MLEAVQLGGAQRIDKHALAASWNGGAAGLEAASDAQQLL